MNTIIFGEILTKILSVRIIIIKSMSIAETLNVVECSLNEILNNTIVSSRIGYDSKLYFLSSASIPEPIESRILDNTVLFFNPRAESRFTGIVFNMNYEDGSIIDQSTLDFGVKTQNFTIFLPYGSNYLIACPRVDYNGEQTEKNLQIINNTGTIIHKFCIGDGVKEIKTTSDGKIIVSYFDEGVFGNYGWDSPMGSSGLNIFNENGDLIWSNQNNPIWDCYALNIDDQSNLFYHYYMDFLVVKVNMKDFKETQMNPNISGSHYILISHDGKKIALSGGYDHQNELFGFDFDEKNQMLENKRELTLSCQGQQVKFSSIKSCGSFFLAFGEDHKQYIGRFN